MPFMRTGGVLSRTLKGWTLGERNDAVRNIFWVSLFFGLSCTYKRVTKRGTGVARNTGYRMGLGAEGAWKLALSSLRLAVDLMANGGIRWFLVCRCFSDILVPIKPVTVKRGM